MNKKVRAGLLVSGALTSILPLLIPMALVMGLVVIISASGGAQPAEASTSTSCPTASESTPLAAAPVLDAAQQVNFQEIFDAAIQATTDRDAVATVVATSLAATSFYNYANDGSDASLSDAERAAAQESLQYKYDRTGVHRDTMGVFQLSPATWGGAEVLMSPKTSTTAFINALLQDPSWETSKARPWEVVVTVLQINPSLASSIQTAYPKAVALLAVRDGSYIAPPTSSSTATAPAEFDPKTIQVPPLPESVYAGITLTAEQMRNAAIIVAVAKKTGMSERAARIALPTSYQESKFDEDAVAGIYVGLFQQNPDPSSGLYMQFPRTDPAGAAWMFFDQLAKRVPDYDTDPREDHLIGEVVQGSTVPENVRPWLQLGVELTAALWPTAGTGAPIGTPGAPAQAVTCADGQQTGTGTETWDAGNIVSDQVFYNTSSMTVQQVREFIAAQNAECTDTTWCAKSILSSWDSWDGSNYCKPVAGQQNADAATLIHTFSVTCGINPQVMLVTWEKESRGITRTDPSSGSYAAAFGYACPDSGPGGSAACDSTKGGLVPQVRGMAWQWARYRVEIPKGTFRYNVGTNQILWNVEESGCGGGPVDIKNVATASLYTYTPYQPNAASLAAFPGVGDNCSSYGNRNFFFMFQKWFGSTGGGTPSGGTGAVPINGVNIQIPDHPEVEPALRGKIIVAPTAQVAAGIAYALGQLGTPYVWGGGGLESANPGDPDNGCNRGGHAKNSCGNTIGFDCSGYSWTTYHHMSPSISLDVGNSGSMSAGGTKIPLSQALPGDLVTYGSPVGHVAVALGYFDGKLAIAEAPDVGMNVRIKFSTRRDVIPSASRYWPAS